MSATPRPWLPFAYNVVRSTDDELAERPIERFESEDDRDLALCAVNCHDELVAALERMLDPNAADRFKVARAAIARAKGAPA